MGLAVGSTLLTGGRPETYPFRLPLSLRERLAFARAGLRVRRAAARADRVVHRHDLEDDRTFGEFLGPLPPAVEAIFSCAAHRATAELDELSAGCGISLFALVWGGKGSLIARNLLGGTGELPAAMARELGDRARTGCRVHGVREDGDVIRSRVINVSQGGVCVEARAPLTIGADVVITLPGLTPAAGVVKWSDGSVYGLAFNRALILSELVEWLQGQQQEQRQRAAV